MVELQRRHHQTNPGRTGKAISSASSFSRQTGQTLFRHMWTIQRKKAAAPTANTMQTRIRVTSPVKLASSSSTMVLACVRRTQSHSPERRRRRSSPRSRRLRWREEPPWLPAPEAVSLAGEKPSAARMGEADDPRFFDLVAIVPLP